jgi:hypothetical protein
VILSPNGAGVVATPEQRGRLSSPNHALQRAGDSRCSPPAAERSVRRLELASRPDDDRGIGETEFGISMRSRLALDRGLE